VSLERYPTRNRGQDYVWGTSGKKIEKEEVGSKLPEKKNKQRNKVGKPWEERAGQDTGVKKRQRMTRRRNW